MNEVSKEVIEEARKLHEESIVIDAHCDSILHTVPRIHKPDWKTRSLIVKSSEGHVDFPRLIEGGVTCQFFAVYVDPPYKPERATERALEMISSFYVEVEKSKNKVLIVDNSNDIVKAKEENKLAALLSLEGGEPVQYNPILLRAFHKLGIRSMSLTWNERNMLADGVSEARTRGGLTSLGLKTIELMEKLGIIIDVSHISESGFWDIIENTHKPIIASHSNCKAICNHPRNLSDEQIKAIAEKGGVIGINFYPKFLTKEEKATIEDIIRHIDHIDKLVGINHVGLGSDFDGISTTPEGLEDVSKLPMLTAKMLEHGYSKNDVKKFLGENFLRVIREVIG